MAAPPAPLPPAIAEQQSPEGAQSAFAAQGVGQPQPGMQAVQGVMQKIQQQEQWLQETVDLLRSFAPQLIPKLAPMAEAVKQLRDSVAQFAQRSGMAQGSPVIGGAPQGAGNPGAAPPNPMGM